MSFKKYCWLSWIFSEVQLSWKDLLKRTGKSGHLCHSFSQWYLFSADFPLATPSLFHLWAFWKTYQGLAITATKHNSFSSTSNWLNQERSKKEAGQPYLLCFPTWPGHCRKQKGAGRRESEDFPNGTNMTSLWLL